MIEAVVNASSASENGLAWFSNFDRITMHALTLIAESDYRTIPTHRDGGYALIKHHGPKSMSDGKLRRHSAGNCRALVSGTAACQCVLDLGRS